MPVGGRQSGVQGREQGERERAGWLRAGTACSRLVACFRALPYLNPHAFARRRWNSPYPPYAPGDAQVDRSVYPVSGAPPDWYVPSLLALNATSGALLWAVPLRAAGAGAVADDSAVIMADAASGGAALGVLLITNPSAAAGGVIAVSAGLQCASQDPLLPCSGHGVCDSCGAGACACSPLSCFVGADCGAPNMCSSRGSCTPGAGCACPPGFTNATSCASCDGCHSGAACDVPDPCEAGGHGACVVDARTGAKAGCVCAGGWSGAACDVAPGSSGAAAAAGAGALAPAAAAGVSVGVLLLLAALALAFAPGERAAAARERARVLAHTHLPPDVARALTGGGSVVGGRWSPLRVPSPGGSGGADSALLGGGGGGGGGASSAERIPLRLSVAAAGGVPRKLSSAFDELGGARVAAAARPASGSNAGAAGALYAL